MEQTVKDPVVVRLKTRREELGLSQSDLGKLCSMPRSVLSRVESGESSPTLRTLRKIASALKTDVEISDLVPSSIERDLMYLKSLGPDKLEQELLSRRWYVHPNDLVGGYCAMPMDTPPSSGCFPIAEFMSEQAAIRIVELHNSTIDSSC